MTQMYLPGYFHCALCQELSQIDFELQEDRPYICEGCAFTVSKFLTVYRQQDINGRWSYWISDDDYLLRRDTTQGKKGG